MKIINAGYEILSEINGNKILKDIEHVGRVCYKSEDRISEESASKFIKMLIDRGHEAMIEHYSFTVKFITDRGVSHELVRHRIASFAQESTRYVSCGYKSLIEIVNEEDCIYAYEQGMSMKKIADKSNGKFTEWEIYKILDKNGIERRSFGSRGIINENYFSKIDTPEKAYLVGLIFADGNISLTDGRYQLTINQKEDEQWWILNMIRSLIQPDAKSLYLHNRQICEDLMNIGIIPNKTYDVTENHISKLWEATEQYRYDFLRGLLDGDGCIRWFYQKETSLSQSCNIQYVGNKYLMTKIADFMKDNYNYLKEPREDSDSKIIMRYEITDHKIGKSFCENLYQNFKFPYGHSKTHRYYNAFDLQLPVLYEEINGKDYYVIKPLFFEDKSLWLWGNSVFNSGLAYLNLLNIGRKPEEARSVLPQSLKTEVVITMNLREWRHFFKLRTAPVAHPQMRELTIPLLAELKSKIPIIFDDIIVKE
jgi:thymidylate synthase ThyX